MQPKVLWWGHELHSTDNAQSRDSHSSLGLDCDVKQANGTAAGEQLP